MAKRRLSTKEIVPLRHVKKAAILAAVRQLHGDIPLAAEKLGIGERTLSRKLEEYGGVSRLRRRKPVHQ